jgi:hypothetical protein
MTNYQIRRGGATLGLFNPGEISRLLASGKLRPTDELEQSPGSWVALATYAPPVGAQPASPIGVTPQFSPPSVSAQNFYVNFNGVRTGPLELSKIVGLAKSGVINASAMLEDLAAPGVLIPLARHVSLPAAQSAPAPVVSPVSLSSAPSYSQPVVTSSTAATVSTKPKVTFLECWLKASLWIYAAIVIFGFLGGNVDGLIGGLIIGILVAPIKGAFWGWIIWLIKK